VRITGYFGALPFQFVGLLNGVAIFPLDRNLFLHEYRSSASYSAVTFILAFTIVELPLQILSSLVSIILYLCLDSNFILTFFYLALHRLAERCSGYAD
jgi:ABC-type multidrug transport system permease subunit